MSLIGQKHIVKKQLFILREIDMDYLLLQKH